MRFVDTNIGERRLQGNGESPGAFTAVCSLYRQIRTLQAKKRGESAVFRSFGWWLLIRNKNVRDR